MNATTRRFSKIAERIQNPQDNEPISAILYEGEIETLPNYINRHLSGKFSVSIRQVSRVQTKRWLCVISYK